MTENLKLKPKKGILKHTSTKAASAAVMFDEANLNADPERGTRQKIDEPKTPYAHQSHSCESDSEEGPARDAQTLTGPALDELHARIEQHQLSAEHRDQFEAQRRAHYNEFRAVKSLLAKKGNSSDSDE